MSLVAAVRKNCVSSVSISADKCFGQRLNPHWGHDHTLYILLSVDVLFVLTAVACYCLYQYIYLQQFYHVVLIYLMLLPRIDTPTRISLF